MTIIEKNGVKMKSTARGLDEIKDFDIINKTFVKDKSFIPFKEIDEYLDQFGLDFFKEYCQKNTKKMQEIIDKIKNILIKSLDGHEKDIQDYKNKRAVYLFNLSINCILLDSLKKLKDVEDPYFEIFNLIKNCWLLYYSRNKPTILDEFKPDFQNIRPIYLALKWFIGEKKTSLREDVKKNIDLYEEILEKRDYE